MSQVERLICFLLLFSSSFSDSSGELDFDTKFVVHGEDASIGDYPFMAGLIYQGKFTCGASIINEFWILSAAHCNYEPSGTRRVTNLFTVMTSTDDLGKGTTSQVVQVKEHPNFKYTSYMDDLLLLKVARALVWSPTQRPTLLPLAMQDIQTSTPVTLLGWGFPKDSGRPVQHLQKANLAIYSQDACVSIYSSVRKIGRSELCAMHPGGGIGQCTGDSGGPLVTRTAKGLVQVGVVSFSQKPCANNKYPGVYVRLSYYIDFIKGNTQL